jgi:multiple sugar transport system permease protein
MLSHKKDYKAWIYILIPLVVLITFTFYPLLNTITVSFFPRASQRSLGSAVGIQSFAAVLSHQTFHWAILNTTILVLIGVPTGIFLALLISVALNSIKPFQKTFQLIFFLPYVTNTIAIGMVFAVLFARSQIVGGVAGTPNGLINMLFGTNTNWVGPNAPRYNWMFAVLVHNIWNGLAFRILIFMGGLQSIGKQYYDAARIDGASRRSILRRITVPLLSPILFYIIITAFIGAFQTYESVLAVAGHNLGGAGSGLAPDRLTLVGYLYEFIGNAGSAPNGATFYSRNAAASMVIFAIILFITFIQMQVAKKRVHY